VVLVGPGQAHDGPVFEHLLAHLKVGRRGGGRPRTRPDRVRADKAYSSRANRARLRRRRIGAVIPEPAEDYKGRNVVERNFNNIKQWRGLATRYDKLAIVYRAAAVLRAITLWLPHLSDTP